MRYRKLGLTGIEMPIIGQGTTGVGRACDNTFKNDKDRIAVLRNGIELGMNYIDTAELYGGGHAEEIVGKTIQGIREHVVIGSKFNPNNSDEKGIRQSLEGSLKRLNTDYIDLYQLHWPSPFIPMEETLSSLDRLLEEQKIRAIGLSNFSLNQLEYALEFLDAGKIAAIQVEYNLIERSIENDLLPFSIKNNISVLCYSLFSFGITHSKKGMEVLEEIALTNNCTIHQIVLAWAKVHDPVVLLVKSRQISNNRHNAAASEIDLTTEELSLINTICQTPICLVPVNEIELREGYYRWPYFSLESAKRNAYDLIPSPIELAENIKKWDIRKPVKLKRLSNNKYVLVSDQIRFWAWQIAYGRDMPIPAYVYN
jgi:aryl-alcohol dehydrogenase-like predicted oxidoreductase